jgi:hypothetical protein
MLKLNIVKRFIIILQLLVIVSCGKNISTVGLGGDISESAIYESSSSKDFVDEYTPSSSNQLNDSLYIQRVNDLIEEVAGRTSLGQDFTRLAKAIAWKESKWAHYYKKNGKLAILKGDSGDSYGMFQINTNFHTPAYQFIDLRQNMEYAIEELLDKYWNEQLAENCNSGSNKNNLIRRISAAYNGGPSRGCRNNHAYDNDLVNIYQQSPWEDYL